MSAKTGAPLYQYVITVHKPDVNAVPFPALGPGWPSNCKVIQPLTGVLEENETVDYELEVSGVHKHAIIVYNYSGNLS